jgi:hypothetical protein
MASLLQAGDRLFAVTRWSLNHKALWKHQDGSYPLPKNKPS